MSYTFLDFNSNAYQRGEQRIVNVHNALILRDVALAVTFQLERGDTATMHRIMQENLS